MGCRQEDLRSRVDQEHPDPTPVEIPANMNSSPLTLRDEMRRFITQEVSKQAAAHGAGSFEDEDDFTEDDPDPDLITPYDVRLLVDPNDETADDLEGSPTAEDKTSMQPQAAEAPAPSPAPDDSSPGEQPVP